MSTTNPGVISAKSDVKKSKVKRELQLSTLTSPKRIRYEKTFMQDGIHQKKFWVFSPLCPIKQPCLKKTVFWGLLFLYTKGFEGFEKDIGTVLEYHPIW